MYLIIVFTITALLYRVVIRDQAGRVKQSVTLQARRVNIIIVNDDHHQLSSTGNKTEGGATQQHVCHENENDDDEAEHQRTNINDIIRNRLMGLIMRRHLIYRLRESHDDSEKGEYEKSEDEAVIGQGEGNPPAYHDIIKEENSSTDEDEH